MGKGKAVKWVYGRSILADLVASLGSSVARFRSDRRPGRGENKDRYLSQGFPWVFCRGLGRGREVASSKRLHSLFSDQDDAVL